MVPVMLRAGVEPKRCAWCAQFVAQSTVPTRWQSRDAGGVWHIHQMTLCPVCRQSAAAASPTWELLA